VKDFIRRLKKSQKMKALKKNYKMLRKLTRVNIAFREKMLWRFVSIAGLNDKRKKDLMSVCIILGPYRNLTTLLGATLFFHPNCQVLNHADRRVLLNRKINFLIDYSSEKFNKFCQFVFFASQRGKRGNYGGSITFAHAFDRQTVKELFYKRYKNRLLKRTINCIVWKGDLDVTNFIRSNEIDLANIFQKNSAIRFIRPIRNPLDCAMSNFRTGYGKRFSDLKNYSLEDILEKIIEDLLWFIRLKDQYPQRFFYFFEDEVNSDFLFELANFLKLNPESQWIEDSLKVMDIRESSYEYPKDLIDQYKRLTNSYFKNYPVLLNSLARFVT